jgi:predicted N-acyltransferase
MELQICDGAEAISETEWASLDTAEDPFASRAFLGTAEKVGASATALGWKPMHLALRSDGELVGLLPLYRRDHSFGDFSRDWNWDSAWTQAGLAYYPKLVSGIPYTPSPGPRLLTRTGSDRQRVTGSLIEAALALTHQTGASSWQCLFVRGSDRELLADAGLLLRRGVQFHWFNRNYRDFEDFLSGFASAKRKKLRRERRAVAESGLRIEVRHGDEISPALWPAIHRHYADTFRRHGNYPAFPPEFFPKVASMLGLRCVVFVAFDGDRPAASAICYRDRHALYGRHWGADRALPNLHFELCYYQGIDYCIREGLARFEPGAQGEHKLARGFEPVPTWCGYWIADRQMRSVIRDYFGREDAAMLDYAAETETRLPFRQTGPRQEP